MAKRSAARVLGICFLGGVALADTLEPISTTGGPAASVIANGQYAYVVHNYNLEAFDVSGGSFLPTMSQDLPQLAGPNHALDGNLLVLAGEGNAALLYDVSDPAVPRYVSRYGAQGQGAPFDRGHTIAVNGNRMVMLLGSGQFGGGELHLEVIDITDPASPTRVSYADLWLDDAAEPIFNPGPAVLRGDTLLVAGQELGVFDLSVADQVSELGAMPIADGEVTRAMVAVANRAAILTSTSRVVVADISNPRVPARRGNIALGARTAGGFAFDGSRAAVALGAGEGKAPELVIVDAANASAPVLAGAVDLGEVTPSFVALGAGRVVSLDAASAVQRLFRLDPAPALLARQRPYSRATAVSFPAYYGGDSAASVTGDLTNPFAPVAVREVAGSVYPLNVRGNPLVGVRSDEQIYLPDAPTSTFWGLYDLSAPLNPRRLGTVEIDYAAPDRLFDSVEFSLSWAEPGRILVRGNGDEGPTLCVIYDTSNPSNVVARGTFPLLPEGGIRIDSMTAKGDYAYVSGLGPEGLAAFTQWNIANPSAPVFVRDLTAPYVDRASTFSNLRVDGNTLYASLGTHLALLDVTNPANPTRRMELQGTSTFVYDYAPDGDLVYVLSTNGSPEERGRLDAFRVEAASATLLGGSDPFVGMLAVKDGLVYVLGDQAAVYQHIEASPADHVVLAALVEHKKALTSDDSTGDGVVDAADCLWRDR